MGAIFERKAMKNGHSAAQNEGFIDIIREKIMYFIVIITHLGLSTSRLFCPTRQLASQQYFVVQIVQIYTEISMIQ